MTLHPPPTDDYADTYDRVRIVYDWSNAEPDDYQPWSVDGFDSLTGAYTREVRNYPTHATAIAAVPAFIRDVAGWARRPPRTTNDA